MICGAEDNPVGVGVVGVGVGVVGVGVGVVGVGVGVGVGLRVGELLCCGVGVRAGDVAGALVAGPCAARLLVALLVVADAAGLLIVEPAPDLRLLCAFAPVGPTDWPGAGALLALGVAPDDASE